MKMERELTRVTFAGRNEAKRNSDGWMLRTIGRVKRNGNDRRVTVKYVQPFARFVNEDAPMRNRNRSRVRLFNDDDDTTYNRFSPRAVGARCGKISLIHE